jgi:two-component system CheB/CheR fusion protein
VLSGPPVVLNPRISATLGMVLYEMASNAAKYGALASETGSLNVEWNLPRDRGRRLTLTWKEKVDHPVPRPSKVGFGTSFIERSLAYELAGTASLTFEADGLRSVLEVPLDPAPVTGPRRVASDGSGS